MPPRQSVRGSCRAHRAIMLVSAVAALMLLGSRITLAQDLDVPVDVQTQLIPKILSYVHDLKTSNDDRFVIGVLFQRSYRTSVEVKNRILSAQPGRRVLGHPVTFIPVNLESEHDLAAALVAAKIDAVYFTPLRAVDATSIGNVCQANGIISFASIPSYTENATCVGFGLRGGKPQIHINLATARATGIEFSSKLLEIARVIR
jgi:hypothetical protein